MALIKSLYDVVSWESDLPSGSERQKHCADEALAQFNIFELASFNKRNVEFFKAGLKCSLYESSTERTAVPNFSMVYGFFK